MESGTCATAGSPLVRVTVVPAAGAGREIVTVAVVLTPPFTSPGGARLMPVRAGELVVPVTVKLRVVDHGLATVPLMASTRQKYVPLGMPLTVARVTSGPVEPTAAVVAKSDRV